MSDGTLTDREREALHHLELGVEWLHRAHGALVEFHHATGHGMDHIDRAEAAFREAGHADVADVLRDRCLPRGVVDGDRWSYDVLEDFEAGLLDDVVAVEARVRRDIAAGRRHITERRQERRWKQRADGEH